jgi:CBS domain-containing protein
MAKAIREVMSSDCTCIGEHETLVEAAKQLAKLDVGAMPICGEDDKLKGMLTDRDIVVKALARGLDPSSTEAGELGEGKPVVVGDTDSVDTALRTMKEHKIRRLPVIDDNKRLVGIVSQGDLATSIDEEQVGELVEVISAAP